MFKEFKGRLRLPEQKWDEYVSCFERIKVPARTILLRENEMSQRMFLIEKGCIRVWFNNNGKDVTAQFFFEHEIVGSIESVIRNVPSPAFIETTEPCTLWWISKNDFNRIIEEVKEIPHLRDMYINRIFDRTFDYMNYFFSSIRDTPQQRYLDLIKNRPKIVQRVPQHYIASYLGISTVHLSRIKSKLVKSR